jgi:hypothetical protein
MEEDYIDDSISLQDFGETKSNCTVIHHQDALVSMSGMYNRADGSCVIVVQEGNVTVRLVGKIPYKERKEHIEVKTGHEYGIVTSKGKEFICCIRA